MTLDIQKLLSALTMHFHNKGEVRTPPIARPVHDWKIILLCVACGLVCASLFAGYVYYTIGTEVESFHAQIPRSRLHEAEITRILDSFNARGLKHDSYTHGGGGTTDPSR